MRTMSSVVRGIFSASPVLPMVLASACANTVQRTDGVTTVRRDYANVHALTQGDATLLIDAGYEEDALDVLDVLERQGIDRGSIVGLVVTHGHTDHASGASVLRDELGVPVIGGRADEGMFSTGHIEGELCPQGAIAERRLEEDAGKTYVPVALDHPVDDVLELEPLLGIDATVTVVPGHTPGSLVVSAGEQVFVGDLLRGSIVGNAAETHFYMCDLEDNRVDVRDVLERLAPDATEVLPGHFGPLRREAVEAWLER